MFCEAKIVTVLTRLSAAQSLCIGKQHCKPEIAIWKAKTVKVLTASGYSSVVSNKMDFGEVKASNHKMDVFCAFNACL